MYSRLMNESLCLHLHLHLSYTHHHHRKSLIIIIPSHLLHITSQPLFLKLSHLHSVRPHEDSALGPASIKVLDSTDTAVVLPRRLVQRHAYPRSACAGDLGHGTYEGDGAETVVGGREESAAELG